MSLVHTLSKHVTDGEYAAFGTLLQLLQWLGIPSVGLQLLFAQLSASAVTEEQQRILASASRFILKSVTVFWFFSALVTLLFSRQLVGVWNLSNAWPLWLTLAMGWISLCLPVFIGILQGQQNFLWMGWAAIANGGGRLVISYLIILLVSATALGMMTGALFGILIATVIVGWRVRSVISGAGERAFRFGVHFGRWMGLTFGYGPIYFMLSADVVMIRGAFSEEQFAPYVAAGVLARALVQITAPLAAVMFPKIVASVTHNKATDPMKLTFYGTLALGSAGVIGLYLLSPLVIKLGFRPSFVSIAPLVPLYAMSMLLLALANVLISDLMARSRWIASPFLAFVAVAYGVTLAFNHDSFKQVILILGGFNLLLLLVAACFTWQRRASSS